jgi:hypothetical protein
MQTYTFIVTRTYETTIEIEAETYSEAYDQFSEKNVYAIELEQCCVIEETLTTKF